MIEKKYNIAVVDGIGVRLAEEIVDFVSNFDCDIFLTHNNAQINMKSIMGFISLLITANSEVSVIFSGDGEVLAAERLENYLKERQIVK